MENGGKNDLLVEGTKLAIVSKINYIEELKDRDKIDFANLAGGWNSIVIKGKHKKGELVIFVKENSIFSEDSKFYNLTKGKPIKIMRFGKKYSDGLIIPLDEYCRDYNVDINSIKEGDDLTSDIKVMKYVPEEEKSIYDTEDFPKELVPKTEEEQGKNFKIRHLRDYKKEEDNLSTVWLDENAYIVITKKVDGTSFTTIIYKDIDKGWTILFCGRNKKLDLNQKINYHYKEIINKHFDLDKMKKYCETNNYSIAIQGEVYGPKINCNRLNEKEFKFKVFNIYDILYKRYIKFDKMKEICDIFGFQTVEVIYKGKFDEKYVNKEILLKITEEQVYDNGELCEGIVFKTEGSGHRFSCKFLSYKYKKKHHC